MNKISKWRCENCNTTWNTKTSFKQHTSMCEFLHNTRKQNAGNMEPFIMPSQTEMFQYIVHLTNKYEELEKKVVRIQAATTRIRRKTIQEYLATTAQKPAVGFNDWVKLIAVSEEDLQTLFDRDLEECVQKILTPWIGGLEPLPIFAFTQRQHTFYMYDEEYGWRIMTNEEFTRFIYSITHKILRTYTKWSKEHYDELHANAKMEEQAILYMSKANGINHTPEKRAAILKKWLFTRLAVSLNQD